MFSDLSDQDKEDFNSTIESVNKELCMGRRKFFLMEKGRENVISEVIEAFTKERWAIFYINGEMTFKENLTKPVDNKPADYRSVK